MGKKKPFTRAEWVTVIALCSVNLASALCVSLQAPFYPLEAEKKGATATEYGLVFGIYELVAFVSCPLFGKYMDKIGAKVLLNSGLIASGISSIIFGLLDLVDSHGWFIGLSFILRIIESLGAAASFIATFSITAVVFPDAVATTVVGGFLCPFLVIGVFLLAVAVFILFTLPSLTENKTSDKPLVHISSVLRLWPVCLDLFAVTAMTISVGYFSATLEPHLRQFGLTPVTTGAMFMISGGTYAITAPLVGRLCDTDMNPKHLIIVGSVLVIISFLLVGPVPYTALEPALWMCIVGLVIHGFGYSCILISAFIDAIHSAVEFGLPNDIKTYGIVSGMWASSFCLGGFIGPSVAGVLNDTVGFRKGILFVVAVHVLLLVTAIWYVCVVDENTTQQVAKSSTLVCDKDKPLEEIVWEDIPYDATAKNTTQQVAKSSTLVCDKDKPLEEIVGEDIPYDTTTKNGYAPVSQHADYIDERKI